jgi:hypothetical protein
MAHGPCCPWRPVRKASAHRLAWRTMSYPWMNQLAKRRRSPPTSLPKGRPCSTDALGAWPGGTTFAPKRHSTLVRALDQHQIVGSMGPGRRRRRQRRHGVVPRPAAEQRPEPAILGHPRAAADRDRDLDRADLPPPPAAGQAGPIGPYRARKHDDTTGQSGRVTETGTYRCSRPPHLPS